MRKIAILVDTQYLYHRLSRRLDYQKLLDCLSDFGEVVDVVAFGRNVKGNGPFRRMLEHIGYTTKFVNTSRTMMADFAIAAGETEATTLFIVSGDPGLAPIVEKYNVVIVNDNLNMSIAKAAKTSIQITEALQCNLSSK